MEIAYLISVAGLLLFGIYVYFHDNHGVFNLTLTPSLVLSISFFLYSISLPLSRLLIGDANITYPPDAATDTAYMFHHLLAVVGIVLGYSIFRTISKNKFKESDALDSEKFLVRRFFLIVICMLVLNIYLVAQNLGGIENIFQPYGYNATQDLFDSSELPATSILDAIGTYLAIVPIVLFFTVKTSRPARLGAVILLGVLGLLFLVRGHRNLLGMLVLPVMAVSMAHKKISLKSIIFVTLGLYFFLYTVAILRNFNLREVNDVVGLVDIQNYDPLSGEFSTSYSVYSKYKEIRNEAELSFGKTYTTDILLNAVPRFIWPSRPITTAQSFSMDYFSSLGHGKGLGFSPVVEAMINFGAWGILPVFCLTTMLVCWTEKVLCSGNAVERASFGFMVPMVFNWNRIDMAITIKMFFVFYVISIMYKKILLVRQKQ